MKKLIIGFLVGSLLMGAGSIIAGSLLDAQKEKMQMDRIERQNDEILKNQKEAKKPC